MEFKAKEGKLFFKSANRIWIFEAKGEQDDGPIGSFGLHSDNNPAQEHLGEVKRDAIKTSWYINSKNEIIVHLMAEQKLVYFSFSGEVLLERDLSDFPNPQKISFCLDNNDNVFFYDNENIYI